MDLGSKRMFMVTGVNPIGSVVHPRCFHNGNFLASLGIKSKAGQLTKKDLS